MARTNYDIRILSAVYVCVCMTYIKAELKENVLKIIANGPNNNPVILNNFASCWSIHLLQSVNSEAQNFKTK